MHILGVKYHNYRIYQALKKTASLLQEEKKASVFFLNLDCLRLALRDAEYKKILKEATLVLSDGVGIRLATKMFGARMRQNCNGTDFTPLLMKEAVRKNYKVFLLGGRKGVAERAAAELLKKTPKLQVVGTQSGYLSDENEIVAQINRSGADILLVGMGSPRQEKWIYRHRAMLEPRLCIGVGGLFDWLSGQARRAPKRLRALQLEWFWRILIDPKRMVKRYVIDGLGFFTYLAFCSLRKRLR